MAHPPLTQQRHRRAAAGFTLIELMIVVALISILTAIGIGMSTDLIPRFRTRQAARTFASKVNECRALAIRSGKECSVWLLAADSSLTNLDSNDGEYWVGLGNKNRASTTWDYLPVDTETGGSDLDQSQGVVDIGDSAGEFYQRRVGIAAWTTLGGPGTGNSDRIVFGPRGFVTNPSSDFGALGTIDITFVNKVARTQGFTEDWTVKVGRTGMTRIDTTVQSEYGGLRSGTTESSSTP